MRLYGDAAGSGTNLPMTFYTTATERMRIDTSGNVGIGTASPSRLLSVYNATAPVIALQNSTTGQTTGDGLQFYVVGATGYIDQKENGSLNFLVNSAERMRIAESGNVGIGTASPGEKLEISSSGNTYQRISAGGNSIAGIKLFASNNYRSVLYYDDAAGTTYLSTAVGTGQVLAIDGAGPILFQRNGTESMRIDSVGFVGIGTNSPTSRLGVSGGIQAIAAANPFPTQGTGLELVYDTAQDSAFVISYNRTATAWKDLRIQGNLIAFSTAATERMRIASNGRVAVGTTGEDAYAQLRVLNALGGATGLPWENSVLTVTSNATMAQGVGGLISFEGNYITGTGSSANYAWIKGAKTNGTSGDASGDLILGARGGNIRFSTSITNSGLSAESMRIDSSGRVGIGTSSPDTTTLLTVNGAMTILGQNTGHGASRLKLGQDTTAISQLRFYGADNSTPGILQFTASSADGNVGGERMRIASNGNVGIGTTNIAANARLSVAQVTEPANIGTQNAPLCVYRVANDSHIGLGYATGIDAFFLGVSYNGTGAYKPLVLATSDTERMRIGSSGDVLVGATSTYVGEKFNVTTAANQKNALFNNTNASYTGLILNLRGSRNTTNGTWGFLQCSRDGVADVLYIYDSGNVVNTNNSYGAISDVKLKENIVDASPKLEDLCKVKVRQYNLKSDPDHKQIGVVAQELEEVFAGLVETIADKDADGNNLGTTTKQVKYSVFVPMLIKAIQEQQAIITDLKTRIELLEGTK
jgi:hypothetical protein